MSEKVDEEMNIIANSIDKKNTDEDITPKINAHQAVDLARKLYGFKVVKIKKLNGYDDRNFHIHVSSDHSNVHVEEICEEGYVLKIINTNDTEWPQAVDMHIHAMFRLNAHGIAAPLPVKNVNGQYFSTEFIHELDQEGNWTKKSPSRRHLVRLCTFIPGITFYDHPNPSLQLFREVGKLVAEMGKALSDLDYHKIFTFSNHGTVWFMKNHHWLKDYVYATRCPSKRQMLREIIGVFEREVQANDDQLTTAIIHNDINEQNILIGKKIDPTTDEEYEICGILDFTDIDRSCKVYDVAITMMYMMTVATNPDFIEVGGAVLEGYLENTDLSKADLEALPYCVVMRYAVSLGMGEHAFSLNPDNPYLLTTAKKGWDQMEKLWTMPWDELRTRWKI